MNKYRIMTTNLTTVSNLDIVYFNTATNNVNYPGYYNIYSTLFSILGTTSTGYGYQGITNPAAKGSPIRASDWLNLKNNLDNIYHHQTNIQQYTTTNIAPTPSTVISSKWVDEIITATNKLLANQYELPYPYGTLPATQYTSTSITTSTTATIWTSDTFITTFDWTNSRSPTDANAINYFFNLGGQISFDIGFSGNPNTGTNQVVANLGHLKPLVYNHSNFHTGTTILGSYQTTDVIHNKLYTATAVVSVSYNGGNQLTAATTITNNATQTNILIVNTVTFDYSVGAINAPIPNVTVGGVLSTYNPPSRILSVESLSTFNCTASDGFGTSQNVIVQNTGNSPVTISTITFFNNVIGAPLPSISYETTGLPTFPYVVPGSGSFDFGLAYSYPDEIFGGPGLNYINEFSIYSNNDTGTVQTLVYLDVAPTSALVPLSFSLSSSTFPATYLQAISTSTQINILSATTTYGPITATLSNYQTTNGPFSITAVGSSYVIVTFNPSLATVGNHSDTVIITATGSGSETTGNTYSASTSVAIDYTPQASSNIATWISPLAANNAIIGISYDSIYVNGGYTKYLTIGVGLEGSNIVSTAYANNNVPSSSTLLANLGFNADTGFLNGQPLYPSTGGTDWGSVLQTYGAWVNTTGETPYLANVGLTPSYQFTVPATATYTVTAAMDDYGSLYIDGNKIIDLTDTSGHIVGVNPAHQANNVTTVNLTAGSHILAFVLKNLVSNTPGAIGVTITDANGNMIWNTRIPVRAGVEPYSLWSEVYRFPILANGTPVTMTNGAYGNFNTYGSYNTYCVKNTLPADGVYAGEQINNAYNYGYFFAGYSMFTVVDNGDDSVTITMPNAPYSAYGQNGGPIGTTGTDPDTDTTTGSLSNAFYYYWNSPNRLTQLGSAGSTTQLFVGFNSAGNTVTNTVNAPATTVTVAPIGNPNRGYGNK